MLNAITIEQGASIVAMISASALSIVADSHASMFGGAFNYALPSPSYNWELGNDLEPGGRLT